jgi:hypothetical protein
MVRLPIPIALPLTVALGAATAGCGKDDTPSSHPQARPSISGAQRGILETVDALQTASRKGDGQAICGDIFTPKLVRSVEAAAKRSCAREVREQLFSPHAEISVSRDIQVSGDQATAVIREQNGRVSKLFMVRRDGRWRIDRVVPQSA